MPDEPEPTVNVICKVCGKPIDFLQELFAFVNQVYYHLECWEDLQYEEGNITNDYICTRFVLDTDCDLTHGLGNGL